MARRTRNDDDHTCLWQDVALERETLLAKHAQQLEVLKQRVNELEQQLAKRPKPHQSERLPTPDAELDAAEAKPKSSGGHTNPDERKKRRDRKTKLETREKVHSIPVEEATCPSCGECVIEMGEGDVSYEYDWLPGRFVRTKHVVKRGRCPCKQHYASGPAPARVVPGGMYGPGLVAKVIVDRCGDATPIYRVEREFGRLGVPIARSTLGDLVHSGANALKPLYLLICALVRSDPHVQADETSMRVQGLKSRAFVWTFLSATHVAYVFAGDRSGETPNDFLGDSTGSLTVDGYSGYNKVTSPDGRVRQGCWSHGRRKLFDSLHQGTDARTVLDLILELFAVERKAKNNGILGTPAHLALRRRRSMEVLGQILVWMRDTRPRYEPSSDMGKAITYMVNQWFALTAFVDDAGIPIHNNASEAALRIIALVRKNSLFFGTIEAGQRYAILHTLMACCERAKINPLDYFADVLLRVKTTAPDALRDLLPDRWSPLPTNDDEWVGDDNVGDDGDDDAA